MRKLTPVLPLIVIAVACSEAGGSEAPTGPVAPPARRPRQPDVPPSNPALPPKSVVDVVGLVVDGDLPVKSRAVRIVDARGVRTDVSTDAAGAFTAAGVALPYDVRVNESRVPDETPLVYLGLVSDRPVLSAVSEERPDPPPTTSHTFSLTVEVPACTTSRCAVGIATWSANGGSSDVTLPYAGGPTTITYSMVHSFVAKSAEEAVTVHALVHDEASSWYRHASTIVYATPKGTSSPPVLVPAPVPVRGPVTVVADSGALPASWRRSVSLDLAYPGGGSATLADVESESLYVGVPDILGATLSAHASIRDPHSDADVSFTASAWSWSAPYPLSATQITLSPEALPRVDAPAIGGTLSRGDVGLAWHSSRDALTTLTVRDAARKSKVLTATTRGEAIPLARLTALGVSLPLGAMTFEMMTAPGRTLEELVEEDGGHGSRALEMKESSLGTYQRFSFSTVP